MEPKIYPHQELIKNLPPEVLRLLAVFGDEIRLVGGAVRDLILQKNVSDFDFATTFLPQEIIQILEKNHIKAIPTGLKFGTITALIAGKNFEITTLRKDSENDGRHCEVQFIDDYFLDAARRDFTINALYLDAKGALYDYFDGISDLKNCKIRFIGEAQKRIEEDFLRILRFFRFSCEYASELDEKGLKACILQKNNLSKLSKERVRAEILKMLNSAKKENLIAVLQVLKNHQIDQEIFIAGLNSKALQSLFEIEKKWQISASLKLKSAALFFIEGMNLKNFFHEICATNLEKRYFSHLWQNEPCNNSSSHQILDLKELKQLLAFFDKSLIFDQYLLFLTKNFDQKKDSEIAKNIQFLQAFSLPNFPLGGKDLIDLGLSGKKLGEALNSAKNFWAENDFQPNKTDLTNFLKK